jgi:hypothetical protein
MRSARFFFVMALSCGGVATLAACRSSKATPISSSAEGTKAARVAPVVVRPDAGLGSTSEEKPTKNSLDSIVAFLTDRAAQSKLQPENVNVSMSGFGITLTESGKGEGGWSFDGKTSDGLLRGLSVNFRPRARPNGEWDPGQWEFQDATFRLQSEKPGDLFANATAVLNKRLKKRAWKSDRGMAWKLKGHWEVSVLRNSDTNSAAEIALAVAEPDGDD